MLFGLVNAGVALWSTYLFSKQLSGARALRAACVIV
jgi:predicted membrane-bound spermidine synthase